MSDESKDHLVMTGPDGKDRVLCGREDLYWFGTRKAERVSCRECLKRLAARKEKTT